MLSSVLKTEVAAKVSINIMRAFVAMRHTLIDGIEYKKELFIMQNSISNINNKLIEHDSKFDTIFNSFKDKNRLFLKNQIYDAYSFILDIFNNSNSELIIIDNYVNKEILDIVSKLNLNIKIVSKNMDEELIKKYNKQYNNVTFIKNDSFHDRFIIVDKKIVFNIGSSIKDLGKKICCVNKITDEKEIDIILKELQM